MGIGEIISYIGSYIFAIGCLALPFVWFSTGRYFDNVIGLKKINNPVADAHIILKSFFRAGQYATLVVFRKGTKKSYDRRIFGEFDFRVHARTIDKIFSFLFCIGFYTGMIVMLIGIAVHSIFYLISLV